MYAGPLGVKRIKIQIAVMSLSLAASVAASKASASASAPGSGSGSGSGLGLGARNVTLPNEKLKARIETQTQAHLLEEAERINRAAEADPSKPRAEVMQEVFDTPDERWPSTKVRTVVMSLHRDYMRMLAPYLNLRTREIAADAPSDEELRLRLQRASKTYATLSRGNQHATWFRVFTDRNETPENRETAYSIIDLGIAVENGRISQEEARAQLSQSRAGILAKARALERLADLETACAAPTKAQIKETRAAYKAVKAADAAAERRRTGGAKSRPKHGAAMPPDVLIQARERAKDIEEAARISAGAGASADTT